MLAAAAVIAGLAVAACGPEHASAPVATPAPGPACGGDHLLQDPTLGWAFCYPPTWKFLERTQSSDTPRGVDVTLDISDAVAQGSEQGQVGFVIIGTYDRGSATSLSGWLAANGLGDLQLEPISWGDAQQAAEARGTTRRFALTPHSVVELDVRAGASQVDVQFATRLSTWRFTY